VATGVTLVWLQFEMRKLHIIGCEEEPELHEGCVEAEDASRAAADAETAGRPAPRPAEEPTG